MESRVDLALERHHKGYNCAQAVLCTYCDLFQVDESVAYRIAEGFGAGMGARQATCGAVTGMFMVLGLMNSNGDIANAGGTKVDTYQLVREKAEEFRQKNSSVICADLLGVAGKPKLRSCDGCIEDACRILEGYMAEQ